MPWTTPETFIAGQTLTAANMNYISGNLTELAPLGQNSTLGAWQSFTPTLSNGWLNGDATLEGKYVKYGRLVLFRASITLGATTTKSVNAIQVNLPVTAAATPTRAPHFAAHLLDAGVADYIGYVLPINTTTIEIRVGNAASTYLTWSVTSSTVPFTWGTSDVITYSGFYESAA